MIINILQHFLVSLLIFAPLESLFPREKGRKLFRRLWRTDIAYMLLAGFPIVVGVTFLSMIGDGVLGPLAGPTVRHAVASQWLIAQVLEIVVIADLGYYWIHRMFHTFPMLWRFHAVHHSIKEMDWLAGARVHPLDQILTRGLSLMIPYALGFSAEAFVIFGFAFSLHSTLKHSNANITFGPLRWVLGTPIYHHWHHANEPEAFNRNFASQLPAIDLLFGTAIMKEDAGPTRYGTDEAVPDGFIDQLFLPFRKSGTPAPDLVASLAETR